MSANVDMLELMGSGFTSSYWNLIVKKEYKSIAAGMEWADECLQLIEQKKRKK